MSQTKHRKSQVKTATVLCTPDSKINGVQLLEPQKSTAELSNNTLGHCAMYHRKVFLWAVKTINVEKLSSLHVVLKTYPNDT